MIYIADLFDQHPVESETLADPDSAGGGGGSQSKCTGENKVYNKTTKRCDCIEGTQADAQGNCVKNCPDKNDRKKDADQGFFTEKQEINGDTIDVRKATFSINSIFNLNSSDVEYITSGVEAVFSVGEFPMDLQFNFDDVNSRNGLVQFKFTSVILNLKTGELSADFAAGSNNETMSGDIVIEIVRNVRLVHLDGRHEDKIVSNNDIISTIAHEFGHTLGLKHIWEDAPDQNTLDYFNFMNSLENEEELQFDGGMTVLPIQKEKMIDHLKSIKRDGNGC